MSDQDNAQKVTPPAAMIYRLIERDGTIWQLGRPWPSPKAAQGDDQIGKIDCIINAILLITDEDEDEDETDPYYQVIGLPAAKGKMADRKLGVTTDIQLEDVRRAEGLQDAEVLAAYLTEMIRSSQESPSPSEDGAPAELPEV